MMIAITSGLSVDFNKMEIYDSKGETLLIKRSVNKINEPHWEIGRGQISPMRELVLTMMIETKLELNYQTWLVEKELLGE